MSRWLSRRSALTLLATVVAALSCSEASEVDLPWHTDLGEAQVEATSRDLPILANFTGSDWCGWCVRLHDEVFSKQEFADWAAENVVLLKVDFPRNTPQPEALRQANQELARRYGIRGYPTILFLQANGKDLGQMGYVPGGPSAFIEQGQRFTRSGR